MRAAVMREPGGPFDVCEVEVPDPGPGEVTVEIRAAGVCASDLSLTTVFGQPTPVVLGHEGAGVITYAGPDVDTVAVGDHVIVLWVPPCHRCAPCRRGDQYLCDSRKSSADTRAAAGGVPEGPYRADGMAVHKGMGTATFAQQTTLAARAVVAIDRDIPFTVAAMLGCAVPTGAGAALRSAGVAPGDRVLVIGAGAVGLNALMGAKVAGASELVAVDPLATRRQQALDLGATESLSPDALDGQRGRFDVAIDAVGAPATVRSAWDAVRRGGTVTVVGAGRPDQEVTFSAYELFHDDKRLTGSFLGGISPYRDLPMLIALWRSGRLPIDQLVSGTAPLDQIDEVVAAQRSGDVVRTVLTPHE